MPNTVFQPGAFQHTQNWSVSNFIQPPTLNLKPRDAVIDACRVALLKIVRNLRLLMLLGKKVLSVASYLKLICFLSSSFRVPCNGNEHNWFRKRIFYFFVFLHLHSSGRLVWGTGPRWLVVFTIATVCVFNDWPLPLSVLGHWIK